MEKIEAYIRKVAKGDEDLAQEMRIGAWMASRKNEAFGYQAGGALRARARVWVKASAQKRTPLYPISEYKDEVQCVRWVDVVAEIL